jgi:HSP20 family molecular chaperone IbpA
MIMLMPVLFGENLFDNFFGDFDKEMKRMDRQLYGKNALRAMKTDVRDADDHYDVAIDLPGFKKEDISLELQNGYITVTAKKNVDKDETSKRGKLIRQERYSGVMSRSFYIGENITEEDIGAKLDNGVLCLTIPKKEEKTLPEKKTIMIEG